MRVRRLGVIALAVCLVPHLTAEDGRLQYVHVRTIRTGRQPKDLLFSPDDRYLMITLLAGRGVQIFDMARGSLTLVSPGEEDAVHRGFVEGVFFDGGREYWFTQMRSSGRVHVLDMESMRVVRTLATGGNWTKVGGFDPAQTRYYATNWLSDDVSVIDPRTHRVLSRFDCAGGREPRGIGFSADGAFVYVVFYGSGEIMKFRVAPGYPLVRRIVTGGANGRFRPDYGRGVAYINNMHLNRFFILDLDTDTITRGVPVWCNPNNLRLSPNGRYVYVSNRGPNNPQSYLLRSPEHGRVQVFDADSAYRRIAEVAAGNQPIGIALTSNHGMLAVSNFQDDTVDLYRIEP